MKLKSKTFGIYFSILSGFTVLVTIILGIILIAFGLASGGNFLMIIPFIVIISIIILMACIGLYVGCRYIRGKVTFQNLTLGKVIIYISIFYFFYTLLTLIFSNLTGNQGGWAKLIFVFIIVITTIPLGYVIKNGVRR